MISINYMQIYNFSQAFHNSFCNFSPPFGVLFCNFSTVHTNSESFCRSQGGQIRIFPNNFEWSPEKIPDPTLLQVEKSEIVRNSDMHPEISSLESCRTVNIESVVNLGI